MAKYRVKIKGKPFEVEAAEDATDEQIVEAISAKHGQQVWGDKMIQNDLDAQKRSYKEQATTYQSYERSDAIMKEVEDKKQQASLKTLETDLRDVWRQEMQLGRTMSAARTANDPEAWRKASSNTEPLFSKREKLLEQLRKVDPKRADELFDELYIKQ